MHSRTSISSTSVSRRLPIQPQVEVLEERLTPAATLPAGFTETPVLAPGTTLVKATTMEIDPTGKIWVLQQEGDVKVVEPDGTTHTAATLTVTSNGERGLLGIAFDPNYDGAGPNIDYVYLYYTATTPAVHNRISRFTVSNAGSDTPTLGSETPILDLENLGSSGNHNGGAIHFGPDGKLYVAVGDNNNDATPESQQLSQRLDSRFGKILRTNPDGSNPSDNPFYTGSSPIRDSIWALGLRNPYTTAFQPGTDLFYINDVGEQTWEEINQGAAGANYGWAGPLSNPLAEGFESPAPPYIRKGAYTDPVMAYDHDDTAPTPAGCAITGGVFYNPTTNQFGNAYTGKYFFADYCGNFIRVFDPSNPGAVAAPDTSTAFASNLTGTHPVDVAIDAAGNLYYLSRGPDPNNGAIYRISFQSTQAPIRLEAETFTLGGAYKLKDKPIASNGQLILVKGTSPKTGTATITFNGPAGTYQVVAGYFDENDGVAQLRVDVGGSLLDSWSLSKNLPRAGMNARTFTTRSLGTVTLTPGTQIKITGTSNQSELAAVDYIDLIPVSGGSATLQASRAAAGEVGWSKRPRLANLTHPTCGCEVGE